MPNLQTYRYGNSWMQASQLNPAYSACAPRTGFPYGPQLQQQMSLNNYAPLSSNITGKL